MLSPDTHTNQADICIFVEGTYPYVTGGVSTWLHQLIAHLPEFTFTIVHLGSRPEPDRAPKYRFPENVVGLQELFLNDAAAFSKPAQRQRRSGRWQKLRELHERLADHMSDGVLESLHSIVGPGRDHLAASDFMFCREAWEILVERYQAKAPSSAFLDFFWTFRSTHMPLLILNDSALPSAGVYHAVSTGYAGYAAALAKMKTGRSLVLTEHGIYTRERDMEIALAAWMDTSPRDFRLNVYGEFFKTWWTNMFRFMSRLTYDQCDYIISITNANQQYQIRDGAEPAKLRLIPNGVDVDRFRSLRVEPPAGPDTFTVGFVGRVVPIKDVKTFIQAIKIASATIPNLMATIIGPTDEDDDYFEECQALIALLGLGERIQFTGRANVFDHYPHMHVLVLTSLSEGQPLVILEANCAGIPVVASDVGACRDLLEGITPEDRQLGPSGLLTLPASPNQTASAIIRLWKEPSLRQQMADAGRERVARFYREDAVYDAYRSLYRELLNEAKVSGKGSLPWPG